MKSAANILERNLLSIHNKATQYDHKRSVLKRSYFDSVDVLMHVTTGYMSAADPTEVHYLKPVFKMAARIYDDFFQKKTTLADTIVVAQTAGSFLARSMEVPFAENE